MACGEAGFDSPFQSSMRNNSSSPIFIGVAGGTASGKSSVCQRIVEDLHHHVTDKSRLTVINQDSFYKNLINDDDKNLAEKGEFNFDHPDAFDFDLMFQVMVDLKSRKSIEIPVYNYKTNSRESVGRVVNPCDVILIEGILVFYTREIRDMFSMKLFVDTDADTRLSRRVLRDIQERGRDLEHIIHQYISLVKPAFEEFCSPTKKYADVIIPRGADNTVAIDLIVQHIIEITRPTSPTKRIRYSSGSFIARPH